MNYVGRFAVPIEPRVLNGITHGQELFRRDQLRGEDKAKFYQDYIALSKAVYPVNVRSLTSCTVKRSFKEWGFRRRSETAADRILRIHRVLASAALLTLIIVQSYWLIGNFLIGNISILSNDLSQARTGLHEFAIRYSLHLDEPQMKNAIEGPTSKNENDDSLKYFTFKDSDVALQEQRMLKTRDETYTWLLELWSSGPVKGLQWLNLLVGLKDPSPNSIGWTSGIVSNQFLSIVQTYVLPLLYGLVGAMAYVLRRLISEINARTYQEESDTAYNLRLYLGVLAGLAIGWFVTPNNKGSENWVQVLPPLALAFLAGYSVELLFSAMDRLLEAFSAKPTTSKST